MNVEEAIERVKEIELIDNPTKEEKFEEKELVKFIGENGDNPSFIAWLAGDYEKAGKYDKALVEYERAVSLGFYPALGNIGDLYYFGKTSHGVEYKKAFECYEKVSKTKVYGDGSFENSYADEHLDGMFKMALMYKRGQYVEKDYDKYKNIIIEAYEESKDKEFYEIDTNIYKEMANIYIKENKINKAIEILDKALHVEMEMFKVCPTENAFLIDIQDTSDRLCSLVDVDDEYFTELDLFELLKGKFSCSFKLGRKTYYIESNDKGEILFNKSQWFRNPVEMFGKAKLDEETLFISELDEIDDWRNLNE